MDPNELMKCEKVAIGLAFEAGRMMLNASGRIKDIQQKAGFADLVTETDKAVEEYIFGQLKKHFPDHKFIGEETASKVELTDDLTWLVDPIDGTMNFVHQFPYFCCSIGLLQNKQPIVGVIYGPFIDKLYTAKKGFGAFCNGKPIHVKNCQAINESLIITELGSYRDSQRREAIFKNLEAIGWGAHGVRAIGSAALNFCSVASGQTEGYYEFGIHSWDMAAGVIILREAGGIVIDTEGGPFDICSRRVIGACNDKIANELSEKLVVHLKLERD